MDKSDLWKVLLCLFVIVVSCVVVAALWKSGLFGWIGYTVAACVWFSATLVMSLLPKKRQSKVWGVTLVLWVPSLSIATNLFFVGSLGSEAFFRFLICTGVTLVYYLFVGVHATYDVDHGVGQESNHDERLS